MKILTLDVENTMYKHQIRGEDGRYNPRDRIGSAFCLPQFLVMVGLKWLGKSSECISWVGMPDIRWVLNQADLVVGFNIKHDLHWLRRVGIENAYDLPIWDCQLGEFILGRQKTPYPSLNDTCAKYGLSQKLDVIENDYWGKGFDTDEIPVDILSEYLDGDLTTTEGVFKQQYFQFKGVRLG